MGFLCGCLGMDGIDWDGGAAFGATVAGVVGTEVVAADGAKADALAAAVGGEDMQGGKCGEE